MNCLHVFAGFFLALKLFRDCSLCSVCIFLPPVCSPYSGFCTQPAFYSQSAVCILHSICILPLAPGVRKADSAVHWVNNYPLDSAIGFPNTYPMDSDLSDGECYLSFKQPGPGPQSAVHGLQSAFYTV